MQFDIKEKLISALPFQVIATENGVILKRGALETHVNGPNAHRVIELLVQRIHRGGATRQTLRNLLPATDWSGLDSLIQKLIDRRLIVEGDEFRPAPSGESELEVFYWNFFISAEEVTSRINEKTITIVGVNRISRRLATALLETGITNFEIVDYPLLRNLRLFDDGGALSDAAWPLSEPADYDRWGEELTPAAVACLVATSDFGGCHWMRQWNELCVANRMKFLPVVLQNMVGYVGPMVVPGESACYECLRARENSHLQNAALERAAELEAYEGQLSGGSHPSVASILGDVATLELTKLYAGAIPYPRVGTLIEVQALRPSIAIHKVLKVPRCAVCSPLVDHPQISARRSTFLPGNRADR